MTIGGSNLGKDARYDQILHLPTLKKRFTNFGGTVDFFGSDARIDELFPGKNYTREKFSFQLSDHVPIWVQIDTDIAVSWTSPQNSNAQDWVGLYRVGDPDAQYYWWRYTGGSATGSLTLRWFQPGQYEFRLFKNNGYERAAVSNPITVTVPAGNYTVTGSPSSVYAGSDLVVNWTAGAGRPATDWVGLYRQVTAA